MKPIGTTNLFTGRIDKKRIHLKDGIEFRVVYENKDGEHFVNYKGKWTPVIKRGDYNEWYERDRKLRKYRVYFDMIDHCAVDVEAESEADAIEFVRNRLHEDNLDTEDYWRESYETKVNDSEEL